MDAMTDALPCQFCGSTFYCKPDLRSHQVNEHGEILLKMDEESHRLSLGIKVEKDSDYPESIGIGNMASAQVTLCAPGSYTRSDSTGTALENKIIRIKIEKPDRPELNTEDDEISTASKLISKNPDAKKRVQGMSPNLQLSNGNDQLTSSVPENIAHSDRSLSSANTVTQAKVKEPLTYTSSSRPLAAVKPRVHRSQLPTTTKRSLDNRIEDGISVIRNTQPEKKSKLSSENSKFTSSKFKSGKQPKGTASASSSVASLPTSETCETRIADKRESKISQPNITSSASSTHKNKRKPITRLPTDRVTFPSIINSDLNQQQPIQSVSMLHISNVSKIPTFMIPTNICALKPCVEELVLPEHTKSVTSQNDALNTSNPSYTSKTIKNIQVWPTNLSIKPKVEIHDLNVGKIKAWLRKNTRIQEKEGLEENAVDKETCPNEIVVQGSKSSANNPPKSYHNEIDSILELRSKKPCTGELVKDTQPQPVCEQCGFRAKSMRGLHTHMKRSHSERETLLQAKILEVIKSSEPAQVSNEDTANPEDSEDSAEILQASRSESGITESTEAEEEESPPVVASTSKSVRGAPRKHCVYCDFRGQTHQAYLDHMKHRHSEIQDNEVDSEVIVGVECPVCQKAFPNGTYEQRQFFQQHLEIHQGLRPFVCPYCEKGFKDPMRLITHASVHNGEGYFDCVKCGEKLKNQTNLALHSRICK